MFERDDAGQDEKRVDDQSLFELMRINNPNMFAVIREGLNKALREGQ